MCFANPLPSVELISNLYLPPAHKQGSRASRDAHASIHHARLLALEAAGACVNDAKPGMCRIGAYPRALECNTGPCLAPTQAHTHTHTFPGHRQSSGAPSPPPLPVHTSKPRQNGSVCLCTRARKLAGVRPWVDLGLSERVDLTKVASNFKSVV